MKAVGFQFGALDILYNMLVSNLLLLEGLRLPILLSGQILGLLSLDA